MNASRCSRPAAIMVAWLFLSLVRSLPGASSAPSPATQYQALTEEFQKAQADFFKVYQAVKTDEERGKIMAAYPQPQRFAPRFLELARKNPTDPAAVDALVWVVSIVRFGAEADQALGTLLKDHLQSDKLGPLCESLAYSQTPQTQKQLRDIIARNPHHAVQGQATFSLAKILQNQAATAPQAEEYFEQILSKFGSVQGNRGTLATLAQAELFEIRTLGIGKPAPDIEGPDVEGKVFKLSDYRGSVVLIDFWGDW